MTGPSPLVVGGRWRWGAWQQLGNERPCHTGAGCLGNRAPRRDRGAAWGKRWCGSVNGRQHKTGCPPRCSAPPDLLDLMLRPSATLTPMGDQPRRPGFVRVAAATPTDLAFDRWPLQCGPFRPARSGTNLQGCRSYRPGRPLWQTAIRKVTETFRKGPEGPPNEPWAAAAFNPEM